MAIPAGLKQPKKDNDMRSRPWSQRTIDPAVVSEEAPAPDGRAEMQRLANEAAANWRPDELTRLTAEVERLRAALRGITALFAASCPDDPRQFDTYNEARAALQEPRT